MFVCVLYIDLLPHLERSTTKWICHYALKDTGWLSTKKKTTGQWIELSKLEKTVLLHLALVKPYSHSGILGFSWSGLLLFCLIFLHSNPQISLMSWVITVDLIEYGHISAVNGLCVKAAKVKGFLKGQLSHQCCLPPFSCTHPHLLNPNQW